MPVWLPHLGAIISALAQLAKLLYELAKEKKGDEIKQCAYEIEKARLTGDTVKLNELIERMKKKGDCE